MHRWPPQLVMVQPYSMLPLIKWDQRRVTMPGGQVVISEAMGTTRRMDNWAIDILRCLVAPRTVQLAHRAEYNDDRVIMMVQVPGIEKIAAGVKERVPYGQGQGSKRTRTAQGRRRPAADDPLGA
jgi:hypothetical protein